MFDFGWAEILMIGAIALFVIGPQDIPKIAYSVGQFFRRIKYMQYALTSQFDDFMDMQDKQKETVKPDKTKEELDHDPMDEAEADAELLEMMPLSELQNSGISDPDSKPDSDSGPDSPSANTIETQKGEASVSEKDHRK